MASHIDEKTVSRLSELARIRLTDEECQRLIKDLEGILAHFDELNALDTKGIEPVAGGSFVRNVLREDEVRENPDRRAGVDQFPAREGDYLEVPKVFS